MDINEATAQAIQAERAIAGLTVRALSERSGIPMSSLMRVLQAERDIKVRQVADLAAAFDIHPHEIVERAEQILARQERRNAAEHDGRVVDFRERRPELPAHVPIDAAALTFEVSHHDADVAREELP